MKNSTSTSPGVESTHPEPPTAAARVEAVEVDTRERVLQSILECGPSTASQLAERLGLTPAAVRRHLATLTDNGAIGSREQRVYGPRGRGRPSRVFYLTDRGRADFYQAYDELAVDALRALASVAGSLAVSELAERRVADVEARYRLARSEDPDATPVQALTKALSATGYVASVQPVSSGEQICQHHCPVAHVAAEFPQLCEAETQLFGRLLGSHVQRLATIAHGDGVCTTHVPRPVAPTS
ncbi:helix-turn-helix transcriptional regulator [Propionibacteriaceae bacterium Y1923]|uniref:helix-turn-helix transcriptional regulator n=1 Tax=Aestuariimicrobium sp. Y1814 TaxID=3418742 RepID=UPI003C25529B